MSHPLLSQIDKKLDLVAEKLEEIKIAQKRKLTAKEAASYLSISLSTLYKLTAASEIAYTKPNGKLIRFFKDDLDSWDNRMRIPSKYEVSQLQSHNRQNFQS